MFAVAKMYGSSDGSMSGFGPMSGFGGFGGYGDLMGPGPMGSDVGSALPGNPFNAILSQPGPMNGMNQGFGQMGQPMVPFGQPMGQHMGQPMGVPVGQPMMGQPMPMPYSQTYAPQYVSSTPVSGAPRVVQYQPAQPTYTYKPAKPDADYPSFVTIHGRQGVNDVVNARYQRKGEHEGRFSFTSMTDEGPIYLYYESATDNWCVGDEVGSKSYYAVCGPSNGDDLAQEWRVWTGEQWETDTTMVATVEYPNA